jgi:hypothetical protein
MSQHNSVSQLDSISGQFGFITVVYRTIRFALDDEYLAVCRATANKSGKLQSREFRQQEAGDADRKTQSKEALLIGWVQEALDSL